MSKLWHSLVFSVVVAPVMAAMLFTGLKCNNNTLQGTELVGLGVLLGPEDLVYDSKSKLIYTGCEDGWIKRVTLNNSVGDAVIQNWINTGGRPLGLTLRNNEIIVADAYRGVLKIVGKSIVVLTDEAEGRRFRLTDSVEIAEDGMIYFTDASYKYDLSEHIWDFLEDKPHGRFMSFDPVTKDTRVLVHDLFFANGIAVSPDQSYVVFCETSKKRCQKYHIKGKESGRVENFIENLPGFPDNIHYDGHGVYWIGLSVGFTAFWDLAFRYPFIRKVAGIVEKYIGMPQMQRYGGVLAVDLEGKPVAYYHHPELILVSSVLRIGDYLYCGSIYNPYIVRLDLNQHPATNPQYDP